MPGVNVLSTTDDPSMFLTTDRRCSTGVIDLKESYLIFISSNRKNSSNRKPSFERPVQVLNTMPPMI